MMVRKQLGVGGTLLSVLAATVMTLSACSSGGGEGATESAPSSADASAVSIAPGVEKDSVLDLNSTKDMTGVVTTVPVGKSPYDKNMPDICNFVTPQAMTQLGVETKQKGFYGSPLVYQACLLKSAPSFSVDFTVVANIYINNLEEHLASPNVSKIQNNPVALFASVKGYLLRNRAIDNAGGTFLCEVAWGTFYGTATVDISDDKSGKDICARAIGAAKLLGPLMPKSPSQMRPTS